jgi:ADP-ribosylation factor GTPase-activating protein 1
MDPNLRQTVGSYVSEAGRIAGDVGSSANEWGKSQLGVDMGRSMGNIVGSVKQSVGGGSANRGYSSLSGYTGDYHDDQTSALYAEAGDDDFFNIQRREVPGAGGSGSVSQAKAPAKDDNDDEWQDW